MKLILKRFLLLSLAILMFLLPIWQGLKGEKNLPDGAAELIVIGIFVLLSAAYWIYIIIYNKKTNKNNKE